MSNVNDAYTISTPTDFFGTLHKLHFETVLIICYLRNCNFSNTTDQNILYSLVHLFFNPIS